MEQVSRKTDKFQSRIHELDFLRGILIILVLLDHLMNHFALAPYLGGLYNAARWYWNNPIRFFVQDFVALPLFVFLSGISCSFSRNNWVRAGEMILLFALISVGTNILFALGVGDFLNMSIRIDFNIIGVLAWSCLIYCFFDKKNDKWLVIMIIIFMLLGQLIPKLKEIAIANDKFETVYLPMFWRPNGELYQADTMPIYPYIVFFFLGALFGRLVYKEKQSLLPRKDFERPICFLGRHTLLIYIAHQFVYILIFLALGAIFK